VKPDLGRFLSVAAPLIRARMMEEGFKADTCVLATRIGMDALRQVRIKSAPRAVSVIASTSAHDRLVREGRFAEAALGAEGAWSVGVGIRNPNNPKPAKAGKWDGHLVLIVEREWLVDLSADQFNRPHKGINVPGPIVARFKPGALTASGSLATRSPDGSTTVRYKADPENAAWKIAPDWNTPEKVSAFVEKVLPALRLTLESLETRA
jgi:hypothetical protein